MPPLVPGLTAFYEACVLKQWELFTKSIVPRPLPAVSRTHAIQWSTCLPLLRLGTGNKVSKNPSEGSNSGF